MEANSLQFEPGGGDLHVAEGTQSVMCAMHLAHDFRVCGNSKSELSKMIYPSTLHLQWSLTAYISFLGQLLILLHKQVSFIYARL